MKTQGKTILRVIAVGLFLGLASCSKDDTEVIDTGFDGSITSIENFYSPELVKSLDSLGFLIHAGNTPPQIEGMYHVGPVILQATSVEGDILGSKFYDYDITFSNQNNADLTVDYLGDQTVEVDEGNGSFISGEGNNFSVFLITHSTIGNYTSDTAFAISGEIDENGITDIQIAAVMLDNKDNPGGVFIPNNKGRVLNDSDGFSEKTEKTEKSIAKIYQMDSGLELLGSCDGQ